MKNAKNMPALRFAEFSEAWEEIKLGETCKIKTGNKDTQNKIDNGLYPFFVRSNIVEKINSYSFDGEAILTSGDGVGVGKNFHYINGKFDFHQRVYSLINFKTKYNGKFIYYLFSEKFYDRVIRLSAKNSVDSVRMDMIYDMVIFFPTLAEQQKIASFFTAIDEKLSQLKKKKNLLESYKKGMMQELFSQKLRFKDDEGNDFEDWKIKRLGDFAEIYDGTHQTPIYVEEGIPFYSVEQITANDFQKTKFISKEVFEKENKRVKIEKGDILMTRIGDVGTSKYIDWDVNASFYVSIVLIKQSTKYNSKYLNQFIGSKFFQNELWNRMIHVAFPKKINLGEIGNCLVKLPCLSEQKKIANFLSAIDERIHCVSNEIKQMEIWKKGLLQQMFV